MLWHSIFHAPKAQNERREKKNIPAIEHNEEKLKKPRATKTFKEFIA